MKLYYTALNNRKIPYIERDGKVWMNCPSMEKLFGMKRNALRKKLVELKDPELITVPAAGGISAYYSSDTVTELWKQVEPIRTSDIEFSMDHFEDWLVDVAYEPEYIEDGVPRINQYRDYNKEFVRKIGLTPLNVSMFDSVFYDYDGPGYSAKAIIISLMLDYGSDRVKFHKWAADHLLEIMWSGGREVSWYGLWRDLKTLLRRKR